MDKRMREEWCTEHAGEKLSLHRSSEHSLSRAPLALTLEDLEQPSKPRKNLLRNQNSFAQKGGNSLRSFKDKSSVGARAMRLPDLEERIVTLEAKAEAQEKALRANEDQLEHSQHILDEKDRILQRVKEELKKLKEELFESCRLCNRTEKQRNEALFNAEELTKAFQQYKNKMTEKMEKVQKEGDLLRKNVSNCENEQGALQQKCVMLETELEKSRELLRNLQSEKISSQERHQCVEAKNAELISLLTQSNQRILRLESELENKEKVLDENKALKDCLTKPKQHLETISDQPLEQPVDSASDASGMLIADLSAKLLIREAENRELQAELINRKLLASSYRNSQENYCYDELDTEPVNLNQQNTAEEKYLQLDFLCKQIQMDKERLAGRVKELQGKLAKAQTELANTKLSMEQRTSQFQLIQKELLEKASKTTKLEQELVKKRVKISALQKMVEEKSQVNSAADARNASLEEKLKRQLEMKNLHVGKQEHTITVLQQETLSKEQQLESLNHLLTQARKELDIQTKNTSAAMKSLENQVEVESAKASQLESALAVCKEELALYLHELEDNREQFEHKIKTKAEELRCLQNEIKLRTRDLQETSEENVRLQQTLQQQQHMLQQGTARIGELEDHQTGLEKQVSKLEYELEKQRSTSEDMLLRTKDSLHAANRELSLKTQEVQELCITLNQVKHERKHSKVKLLQMEEELVSFKNKEENNASMLKQLQMDMQKTQVEMDKKTCAVTELEEKLHIAQKDITRKEEMEIQYSAMQKELEGYTKHVEELQETLTKTHLSVEEKQVIIQGLTEKLRSCKQELEERDHELLDMDQLLKDRNWELKQRATQLTQLDMSIREHKGEMEQKVGKLESALAKAELEAQDHIKEITSLDERLQQARDQLCEKDFDLMQKDQVINQLKNGIERNQQTVTAMEKTLKAQERHISEKHKDGMDLSEQLNLEQEQMQLTHQELLESRQQLAEAQKESDRLTQKLEGMDLIFREKLQHLKHKLEETNYTICNLKVELQARNEVIKATNDVLILKESELTRLKARISSYERTLGLKQLSDTTALPSVSFTDLQPLESSIHPEASDFKMWHISPSLIASNLSLTDMSSLELPKSMLEDLKNLAPPDSPSMKDTSEAVSCVSSESLNNSSFNPLTYALDFTSDCPDLTTLTGMLKYIKKEMRLSEYPQEHSPSKDAKIDGGPLG
ncbi:cytoskeletal protein Sojo-like isoform X2 [Xenopus laevis]|uniref:Cytoskeletal protein Sojo-like isoform X2 n=1 Tax=Xenopus laevis TaxID=8355 RepID=A0A8J0VBV2_XENLA|nr:cytoskeletal protein Sojo-like isoform X2 [Xenopus laevis]